jgi:hypothetical protein
MKEVSEQKTRHQLVLSHKNMRFSPGIPLVFGEDLSSGLNWEIFSAFRTSSFRIYTIFGNNEQDNSIALVSSSM